MISFVSLEISISIIKAMRPMKRHTGVLYRNKQYVPVIVNEGTDFECIVYERTGKNTARPMFERYDIIKEYEQILRRPPPNIPVRPRYVLNEGDQFTNVSIHKDKSYQIRKSMITRLVVVSNGIATIEIGTRQYEIQTMRSYLLPAAKVRNNKDRVLKITIIDRF
ncbi:hypothetical protein GJ496_011552 [Pomphorhynchus laevis]|nr:hypothetical protein GJ496_011552 [Pomphorhynchus laevis]